MKYIKSIQIFENHQLTIDELLNLFLEDNKKIINWWEENRKEITNIYLFTPIKSNILGCFIDENTICINNNILSHFPSNFILWCIIHESRHADQDRNGIFSKGYFETVINNDLNGFLKSYKELEKDANDFAEKSFKEIGINLSKDFIKQMRSNENAGHFIFHMMKNDIQKCNAKTFKDLILSQIKILN